MLDINKINKGDRKTMINKRTTSKPKKMSKRLTLSQIRSKSKDYFFTRSTMKHYRGAKYSTRYDPVKQKNYVKVTTKDNRIVWYSFNAKTGKTRYISERPKNVKP